MNIQLIENYDIALKHLGERHFYIFGITTYANMFYLYCKEKHMEQNIDAFLVSDLSRDKRKMHILHGIPVRDLDWVKKGRRSYPVFIAGREKNIENQFLPLLCETPCREGYYVSDFVHGIMYARFMSTFYEDIISRYRFSSRWHEGDCGEIGDMGSSHFYKYCSRAGAGFEPDEGIFHGGRTLDEMHDKQFGDYGGLGEEKEAKRTCTCRLYAVRSHVDQERKEDFYTPYTVDIQAGVALTDRTIAEIKDNSGDNVSARNRDYCELSAVYWIWKNDLAADYVGICHYRRRFVINEAMINQMVNRDLDGVFPIPILMDGGMRTEFVERNYFLTPHMWEMTGQVLGECFPEYQDAWEEFGQSYFIIPCNMFIMRRDMFDRYCGWLFKILGEIDNVYLRQGIQWDNRYLGYIGECLMNVFVMKHKRELKKGYVRMKILN